MHNAASLGDVSKRVRELDDAERLRDYFDLNITSVLVLNSVFFKHFNEKVVPHQTVVQTSSICALQPFKTWSLYCSGKWKPPRGKVCILICFFFFFFFFVFSFAML